MVKRYGMFQPVLAVMDGSSGPQGPIGISGIIDVSLISRHGTLL